MAEHSTPRRAAVETVDDVPAVARRASEETSVEETSLDPTPAAPRRLLGALGVATLALGVATTSLWAVNRPEAQSQVQAVVASETPLDAPTAVPSPVKASTTPVTRSTLRPAILPAPTPTPTAKATKSTPEVKVTAKPTPKATVTPTTKAPLLGVRYTEQAVNARLTPSADGKVVEVIGEGTKLKVTTVIEGKYRQVSWQGQRVWVADEFLTKTKPAPEKPTTTGKQDKQSDQKSTPSSGDDSISSSPCPRGSSIEGGLTSRAVDLYRAVCAKFPYVKSYGGLRPGDSGDHGSGRAIDIMISGSAGWDIANWLRANASRLGVKEVIYQQKIWTTQRSGDGWRWMSDRGSATANHYDHVHVAVR